MQFQTTSDGAIAGGADSGNKSVTTNGDQVVILEAYKIQLAKNTAYRGYISTAVTGTASAYGDITVFEVRRV